MGPEESFRIWFTILLHVLLTSPIDFPRLSAERLASCRAGRHFISITRFINNGDNDHRDQLQLMLDLRLKCYCYQERTSNVSVVVDLLLMSRLISPAGLGRDIEMILMR